MKLNSIVCAFVLLWAAAFQTFAQGTTFTYQGRLTSSGSPFTGTAEIQPTLWNDPTAGAQVAANNPASVIVNVTNGLFVLPLDFGGAGFNGGADRWLQLQVRTTIGPYTTLTPRQQLTPTPYAIYSANAATATTATTASSVPAANITGQLGLTQLPPTLVTNTQSGLNLNGSFTGDGAGLTNLSTGGLGFFGTSLSVTSWGWNDYGQRNVPTDVNDFVAVAGGITHGLGLRANGTVIAWGSGTTNNPTNGIDLGQAIVPPGLSNVVAVSAGYLHSLALKSDGTVVAWGSNLGGEATVPPGLSGVKAISGGLYQSLALLSNGTVVAWGTNDHGQVTVPGGLNDIKAISAGYVHNLALRSNGTVVVWGGNDFNATNMPAGLTNVVAIAAGATINLALKQNGTVAIWGTNINGELDVPPGLTNIVAITAGLQNGAVLKADGTLLAWGHSDYGETNVPAGLNNIVSLARAFGYHFLALRKKSDAPVAWLNSDNTFNGNIQVNGNLQASGEIIANAGLRLNEQTLWLRGANDKKNGLGWYGGTKPFSFYAPNGPVLFGEKGGLLGTMDTNGAHVAVQWDSQQRLTIGDNSSATPTIMFGNNGTGIAGAAGDLRIYGSLSGGRVTFYNSLNGSEQVGISSSGSVGIGTPLPGAKLDVRGDVKFGTSGQYYAVAGDDTFRIVRGVVGPTGSIIAGTGFTVTKGVTGFYTINFSPSFFSMPAVTVTPQSGIDRIATCTSVSTSSTGIWTRDSAGTAVDNQFNFIAIGPR
jgi:hypothetical protein